MIFSTGHVFTIKNSLEITDILMLKGRVTKIFSSDDFVRGDGTIAVFFKKGSFKNQFKRVKKKEGATP
jgi:hypothetical protein